MDALILCGGFAKRLEPISEFIPKPLLHVNGMPILDHIVRRAERTNPKRIIITTNRKFAPEFRYWMDCKGRSKRIQLLVEPTTHHNEKFGSIKSIDHAIKKSSINDDMLILAGDNYFSFDVLSLKRDMEKMGKPVIALYDVKSHSRAKRFGVVKTAKDNRILEFMEKPEHVESTLVSAGIYAFPKSYLGRFGIYLKKGGNPDAIGHFLEWMLKDDEVYGHVYHNGFLFDIGTISMYRKLFYWYK